MSTRPGAPPRRDPGGIIRAARRSDGAALAALAETFHREDGHPLAPDGARALVKMLAPQTDFGRAVVAAIGNDIVGYAVLCFGYSIEHGGRDGFVDDIYVVPKLRGAGLGKRLYSALESAARTAGCRALHLEVMPGNRAARWYRKLGYTQRRSKLMTRRL